MMFLYVIWKEWKNEYKSWNYYNNEYLKLKENILKYKEHGIYKNFKLKEKLKLFLVLHFKKIISVIINKNHI